MREEEPGWPECRLEGGSRCKAGYQGSVSGCCSQQCSDSEQTVYITEEALLEKEPG